MESKDEKKGEDITILPQNPKKRMVEDDMPLERRNHETPKIPSPSPSLSSPQGKIKEILVEDNGEVLMKQRRRSWRNQH